MADELPEYIKMKLLKKWMSEQLKKSVEEKKKPVIDPEKIVWEKLSDDRAKELMGKAKQLYPEGYRYAVSVFYELIRQGIVKELDGYTVYALLQRIGIPVKPDLRIKFVKHGKEVSMKEYLE